MKSVNYKGRVYGIVPSGEGFILKDVRGTQQPDTFKVGDKVSFTRQVAGRETKKLTGEIIQIGWSVYSDFPIAGVKARCEYGDALPYNHELHLIELTKV